MMKTLKICFIAAIKFTRFDERVNESINVLTAVSREVPVLIGDHRSPAQPHARPVSAREVRDRLHQHGGEDHSGKQRSHQVRRRTGAGLRSGA